MEWEYFKKIVDSFGKSIKGKHGFYIYDEINAHRDRDKILIELLRKHNPKAADEAEKIEEEIGFWYE